jgi:DNA-binding transcriptional LysR family regulator
MNWDDLRIVLALSRSGTLAGAARVLEIDATTVGRRVAMVEADLGARLFERESSGYAPTDAGHRAIAHAEHIERATVALQNEVEGSDQRVEGRVRLTGLDAIFDILIIPRLPRLLARYPGLEITFSSKLDFMDLSRREADIALRSREPRHPESVGRNLGRLAQAVYAAKRMEIGDRPSLIGLPSEYDSSEFARVVYDHFPNGRMVARGNSEGHIRALIKAGVGIGMLDCFAGDRDPELRRVVKKPVWTQTAWAEIHVAMAKAPRIRAVTDFLRDVFAEESELLAGNCAP